jgi:hypothetical protein
MHAGLEAPSLGFESMTFRSRSRAAYPWLVDMILLQHAHSSSPRTNDQAASRRRHNSDPRVLHAGSISRLFRAPRESNSDRLD